MNKAIEVLKERIVACIDEKDKPYVISLLNDLENAIHEHSFDDVLEIPLIVERKTTQYGGVSWIKQHTTHFQFLK